jgi:hypothetical protein
MKMYLKIMSRVLATYLFLLPISKIGIAEPSKATIVAGMVSLFYLIVCGIADGIDKNSAD